MCDIAWSIIIVCLTLSIASIVVALNEKIKRIKESNKILDEIIYLHKVIQDIEIILGKILEAGAEMTESQVKQMQKKLDNLTESNNNLVQNQQLAMVAIQELVQRVKKLESKEQTDKLKKESK